MKLDSPQDTPERSPQLLHILLGAVRGGCERDCEMLVRHLPHVSHRVIVLGDDGPMTATWAAAGAVVEVVGPVPRLSISLVVRDSAARIKPAAAVVWHGLPNLPQILHGLAPSGARVVVHGGNPAHTMPRWIDWKYLLLGAAHPIRRMPTYVCCSRYVADSFVHSRYLRRFPRVVVPNGVELPTNGVHRSRAFAPADRFVIGMLGRLDRIKDHATLLRAFALVRNSHPLAELELAGAGSERGPLQALADSLGVAGSVRFLGNVTDIYGVMAGWDLFAYATTEAEGMGNTVAEAMMFGLPSVLTDIGPIREVCGPDEVALLVPPRDPVALAVALGRLAADFGTRGRLSEAGRRWAETQFHPETFARRYAEILLPQRAP